MGNFLCLAIQRLRQNLDGREIKPPTIMVKKCAKCTFAVQENKFERTRMAGGGVTRSNDDERLNQEGRNFVNKRRGVLHRLHALR